MVAASEAPVLLPSALCQLPSLGARVVVEGEGSKPSDAWHLTLYLSIVSAASAPACAVVTGEVSAEALPGK